MHLGAMPAVVRRHYDQLAAGNRSRVAGGMHVAQRALIDQIVELVAAGEGPAVTEEMFGRHQGMRRGQEVRSADLALYPATIARAYAATRSGSSE